MKNRFLEGIESNELLNILENSYLKEKINLLLSNENLVYTKKGRLNKSGACRILDMKNKELETFLEECRKVLEVDPQNQEALQNKQQIEDIYTQMGRPIPQ